MTMRGTIKKYVSRYVVPFYFEYRNDGYTRLVNYFRSDERDYKEIGLPKDCKWTEQGFWEKNKSDGTAQPEMDIYTYLLEILKDEEKNNVNNDVDNIGVSFVLTTNGNLFNLQYVKSEEKEGINFTFIIIMFIIILLAIIFLFPILLDYI